MSDAFHDESLEAYACYLRSEEKAPATIEKYLRDIGTFIRWLDEQSTVHQGSGLHNLDTNTCRHDEPAATRGSSVADKLGGVTNETITRWKGELLAGKLAASTVNSKMAALNSYFAYLGRSDLHARFLKVQRRVFRDPARDITREDYKRLLAEARRRKLQTLSLVMETICATGMRVSELAYITVETLAATRVDVALKGKIRTIFLPKKLRSKLTRYAKSRRLTTGPIFLNTDGSRLTRHSIWAQMKALARKAHVNPMKVFPHNLRHLFAITFYQATNDIVKLADVLGHSSIETTRIYLMTSGREYGRLLEQLDLVA